MITRGLLNSNTVNQSRRNGQLFCFVPNSYQLYGCAQGLEHTPLIIYCPTEYRNVTNVERRTTNRHVGYHTAVCKNKYIEYDMSSGRIRSYNRVGYTFLVVTARRSKFRRLSLGFWPEHAWPQGVSDALLQIDVAPTIQLRCHDS